MENTVYNKTVFFKGKMAAYFSSVTLERNTFWIPRGWTMLQTMHLLPENLCRAVGSFQGAVATRAITADSSIGHGFTWPRQGALERAAQVVKCPCDDHVIVKTHQCGHAQHPDSNTYVKRHENGYKHLRKT